MSLACTAGPAVAHERRPRSFVRRLSAAIAAGWLCVGAALTPTACAQTVSAQMGLRFDGRTPHAEIIQRVYSQIPDAWKRLRPVVVTECSDAAMRLLVAGTERAGTHSDDDSTVDGCYQPAEGKDPTAPARITLTESLSPEETELVFTHEFGHLIWDDLLTRAQRRSYASVWRRQSRACRLVTDYACECVEEGFADSFAYFLRKPAFLKKRDPRSFAFLADTEARLRPGGPAQQPRPPDSSGSCGR